MLLVYDSELQLSIVGKGSREIVTNLLAALDNDYVIVKLANILSASIVLSICEMGEPLYKKLDKSNHKFIIDRVAKVESENVKLKETNNGLLETVSQLTTRVSQLEQAQLYCDVIIHGVKDTNA